MPFFSEGRLEGDINLTDISIELFLFPTKNGKAVKIVKFRFESQHEIFRLSYNDIVIVIC